MSDHEQLHEDREEEARGLEGANERLAEGIEEARSARDRAASDEFIASPAGADSDASGDQPVGDLTDVGDSQGEGPPPETGYTSKE